MKAKIQKFKVGQKVRVLNSARSRRELVRVFLDGPEQYLGKVGTITEAEPYFSSGPLNGCVSVRFVDDKLVYVQPSILRAVVRGRPALRKTEKKSAARKGFK